MSKGDDDTEKTQDPTPKKLEDARKRGEIPKSTDLTTSASYLGFILALMLLGIEGATKMLGTLSTLFRDADRLAVSMSELGGQWLMGSIVTAMTSVLLPIFGVPALAVLLTLFAQRAFVFAPEKVAPKLNRISMISGVKNKFGAKGLFEFAKSSFKLVVISILLVWFLSGRIDELITTTAMTPGQLATGIGAILMEFLALIFVLTFIIGGADYLWQIAHHIKTNRMSFKEIKDETKESEGDPHFKGIRRQRGYDIAMNQMLADVPEANVIVVNPTHYAVALTWDRSAGTAPICVAKGVDEIAARIREIADESDVPIFSDPPTARALHATVEIGDQIQRDHYAAVAAAIRFAEDMRQKMRGTPYRD